MRDAFGGAFSVKLMLIFLMLYVSFMCVALSYARAFRVKNRIINIIEQNEGYVDNSDVTNKISNYLRSAGYSVKKEEVIEKSSCKDGGYFVEPGCCIVPISSNPTYYKVETYMVFRIPIVNNLKFPIAIVGETKRIETVY